MQNPKPLWAESNLLLFTVFLVAMTVSTMAGELSKEIEFARKPADLSGWVQRVGQLSDSEVKALCEALSEFDCLSAIPFLTPIVDKGSENAVKYAVEALVKIDLAPIVPALIKACQDRRPAVRTHGFEWALRSRACRGHLNFCTQLRTWMLDKACDWNALAGRALLELGSVEEKQEAAAFLVKSGKLDLEADEDLAIGLAEQGQGVSKQALFELIEEGGNRGEWASSALTKLVAKGHLLDQKDLDLLESHLTTAQYDIASNIVEILAECGSPEAARILASNISESAASDCIVRSMWRMDPEACLATFRSILEADYDSRAWLICLYGKEYPALLPTLLARIARPAPKAHKHKEEINAARAMALECVTKIKKKAGVTPEELIIFLRKHESDPDESVATMALYCLKEIKEFTPDDPFDSVVKRLANSKREDSRAGASGWVARFPQRYRTLLNRLAADESQRIRAWMRIAALRNPGILKDEEAVRLVHEHLLNEDPDNQTEKIFAAFIEGAHSGRWSFFKKLLAKANPDDTDFKSPYHRAIGALVNSGDEAWQFLLKEFPTLTHHLKYVTLHYLEDQRLGPEERFRTWTKTCMEILKGQDDTLIDEVLDIHRNHPQLFNTKAELDEMMAHCQRLIAGHVDGNKAYLSTQYDLDALACNIRNAMKKYPEEDRLKWNRAAEGGLDTESLGEQIFACTLLRAIGQEPDLPFQATEAAAKKLTVILIEGRTMLRAQAARILGRYPYPPVEAALLQSFQDDPYCRLEVMDALAQIKSEKAIPTLKSALKGGRFHREYDEWKVWKALLQIDTKDVRAFAHEALQPPLMDHADGLFDAILWLKDEALFKVMLEQYPHYRKKVREQIDVRIQNSKMEDSWIQAWKVARRSIVED